MLIPPKSGAYALGGYGFNGFRIYLEDSLLVKFDGEFDPAKTYQTVNLVAGKIYKIKMEFYKKMRYSFVQLIWSVPDEDMEKRAIAAAQKADAVILFMGLSPRLEGEEMKVEVKGFKGGDRMTLDLPETQSRFIKKIYALGKPTILVLLNGSALAINWEKKNIPAILETWYPGQAAGTAIADILFGDFNPAGRLPVTFYNSVDQLPPFNDYNMTNRTYRYFKEEPLYPFGYGLSYSKFVYKNLRLSKKKIDECGTVLLSVDVTNKSKIKGEEVIQLYIKAEKDIKLNKALKGFKRVLFNPGETKTVEFIITPDLLTRWIDGKGYSVEKDIYKLSVNPGSKTEKQNEIKLTVY